MKKIMIVDDNSDLSYIVKTGLEKLDSEYTVTEVPSGNECFKCLETGELPDLILLDVMMPEMNGWDVFAKIKQNPYWQNIPIVFLTAKTDPYSKGFGNITANDYIEKPFEITELKHRIEKVLRN